MFLSLILLVQSLKRKRKKIWTRLELVWRWVRAGGWGVEGEG